MCSPHYKYNHYNIARTLWIPLILGVKVLHIICNMGTSGLPDMYAICLKPKGHTSPRLYISGRPFVPMLQILNVPFIEYYCLLKILVTFIISYMYLMANLKILKPRALNTSKFQRFWFLNRYNVQAISYYIAIHSYTFLFYITGVRVPVVNFIANNLQEYLNGQSSRYIILCNNIMIVYNLYSLTKTVVIFYHCKQFSYLVCYKLEGTNLFKFIVNIFYTHSSTL